MSDTKLNDFLASGPAADRIAFTPTPPTPASGPAPGYFWFESDTGDTYSWDAGTSAWVKIASSTATGNVTTSSTLTAHAVVLGNGTSDVTVLGSLGTTTTVLHGNAAGDPTFSAVDLANDVTGTLPVGNGGTGQTTYAKGDLLASPGTSLNKLGIGTDGQVLTADSASTNGMKWAAAAGGGDFAKIEQQTPSAVSSITFSALGSYTHLVLMWTARSTDSSASVNMRLTFNSDSGANYDLERLQVQATSTTSSETLAGTSASIATVVADSSPAGMATSGRVTIYDYIGSFQKNGTTELFAHRDTSSGNQLLQMHGFGWRSTAAITSITLALSAGNFASGSKFTLYGLS